MPARQRCVSRRFHYPRSGISSQHRVWYLAGPPIMILLSPCKGMPWNQYRARMVSCQRLWLQPQRGSSRNYVAPAEKMVGRAPLIPLFLAGNTTPTIPHVYSKRKDSGFPMGCADAAALDGRRGSNVYEVNPWLWQFGHGKPRRLPIGSSLRTLTERSMRRRLVSVARRIEPDGKLNCVWYMFEPVITSIDLVCTLSIPSTNQVYQLHI
jgi:hypothetical protein